MPDLARHAFSLTAGIIARIPLRDRHEKWATVSVAVPRRRRYATQLCVDGLPQSIDPGGLLSGGGGLPQAQAVYDKNEKNKIKMVSIDI